MENEEQKYEYVGIDDLAMRYAYDRAKELYLHRGWNLKATPVAVLMRGAEIVTWAAAADGRHALHGRCDRLHRRGSDYSECRWCQEDQHAEQIALRYAKELGVSVKGCDLYLYGHWRMCDACVKALRAAGIQRLVLLDKSERLFDRHHPDTVIGRPEQFAL